MVISKIKDDWYKLESWSNFGRKLVWFARTRAEVRHKFQAWVREHDLEKIRRTPTIIREVVIYRE